MPDERVTGIQAWLSKYSFPVLYERFKNPGKINVLGGVEFSGPTYRAVCTELSDQIEDIRGRKFTEIDLPDLFDASQLKASVRRSGKTAWAKIGDLAELRCEGNSFQASQGMVDLLSLPGSFVEEVEERQRGLLLAITNRHFEMVTDPAETRSLAIARLEVTPRKKKLPVINLEPLSGIEEKKEALKAGGPVFVIDRDARPPFKRAEPVLSEKVSPKKEPLSEEENIHFLEFCKKYMIYDKKLQALFLEIAGFERGEMRLPNAKTTHKDKLIEIMAVAFEERAINDWEFKKVEEALEKGRGSPDDFWTPQLIRSFTYWLWGKYPEAFQKSGTT
jgi:hypothetical protein